MLCMLSCVSRYKSVEDLGSPSDAANKLLDRYLNKEFMSTRIGIRRQGEVLAASSRDKDGRKYYDVEVRLFVRLLLFVYCPRPLLCGAWQRRETAVLDAPQCTRHHLAHVVQCPHTLWPAAVT
jgi:hypothetical protein